MLNYVHQLVSKCVCMLFGADLLEKMLMKVVRVKQSKIIS